MTGIDPDGYASGTTGVTFSVKPVTGVTFKYITDKTLPELKGTVYSKPVLVPAPNTEQSGEVVVKVIVMPSDPNTNSN